MFDLDDKISSTQATAKLRRPPAASLAMRYNTINAPHLHSLLWLDMPQILLLPVDGPSMAYSADLVQLRSFWWVRCLIMRTGEYIRPARAL